MPFYAILSNWTEAGIKSVKQAPQRGEAFRQAVESAGGHIVSFLHTMGAFDVVATVELPSDEIANEIILRLGMQGFARTITLKGWAPPEFTKLVGKL